MNPSRSTSRRSKDSRRINSRKPSSTRTGFRAAKRGAHEDLAAPAQNAAQPSAAASGDRLSAAAVPPPHSLQTRAGRQDWEAVLRLLVKIRIDGDAAAARLGDASPQHDGLAAV